ncbi:unnamed protein product [Fraxinus pennsylvanica]|uniref:Protein kinase domain-containing protein n=1 Tax=Fraxinus pennsylvanica TaxID=56036 RepID=A0AAD2DYY7_9LAMI|nr:unnamed protein product [Fraxinus pennsylvanica]
MGCFRCYGESSVKKPVKRGNNTTNSQCKGDDHAQLMTDAFKVSPQNYVKEESKVLVDQPAVEEDADASKRTSADDETNAIKARKFTFAELVAATENFKPDYFLGEGGFGKVYKGHLQDSGQIVAIKQLDRNGCQGIREFVVEVFTLSMADHPNLVKLIGYCAEGDQRLLVYEYMLLGSLEDHLHDLRPNKEPLDWNTRMKIAAGAAKGLDFGVVLLELITGRKAIDETREGAAKNLVAWARPLFKDRKKFYKMADPVLHGQYPARGLYQALAIAAMCVQEQPNMRPLIADVVTALNYLASQSYDPKIHQSQIPQSPSSHMFKGDNKQEPFIGD